MPRWVKVSAIGVGVVVLVVVAAMLIFGGDHGPGRHLPGGGPPGGVEAPQVPGEEAAQGHTPPAGGHG